MRLRVLPFGDSITRGWYPSTTDLRFPGYRGPLATLLRNAGVVVEYVGWIVDENGLRHEGHGGMRIDQLTPYAEAAIAWRPDRVLLMAGSNDVLWGADAGTMLARLETLMRELAGPWTIHVSTIPKLPFEHLDVVAREYNRRIPEVLRRVRGRFTDGGRAVDFSSDRTHPSPKGYRQIARAWRDSLLGGTIARVAGPLGLLAAGRFLGARGGLRF